MCERHDHEFTLGISFTKAKSWRVDMKYDLGGTDRGQFVYSKHFPNQETKLSSDLNWEMGWKEQNQRNPETADPRSSLSRTKTWASMEISFFEKRQGSGGMLSSLLTNTYMPSRILYYQAVIHPHSLSIRGHPCSGIGVAASNINVWSLFVLFYEELWIIFLPRVILLGPWVLILTK